MQIFVTPCSLYVLLQYDGKSRCFFAITMPGSIKRNRVRVDIGVRLKKIGHDYPETGKHLQNCIENLNCPDCVGWSKEQCRFATGGLLFDRSS